MKKILLSFGLLVITTQAISQSTFGLVSHYSFNTANSLDEVGTNDLTLMNGALYGLDRFGNASRSVRLDGANDYMRTNSPFFYPGAAYTISVWFKSSSASQTSQTFVNTFPHTQLTLGYNFYSDNSFDSGLGDGSDWTICSATANGLDTFNVAGIDVTEWNNYVLTYDLTTWNYYMNNVLVNSCGSGIPANVVSDLFFGSISFGPLSFFNGYLDDIRVYNRALNLNEVAQLLYEDNPVVNLDENELNFMTISPNPAVTSIKVTLKSPAHVTLTNVLGDELSTIQVTESENIDLSNLSNGVYFLKTTNGKTLKFIKQ